MTDEAGASSSGWWDAVKREKSSPEPVWTYRGYRLKASEFNTAMVHFFRSQVQRADVWRQRLDATTNWAVITTAATIPLAFSRGLGSHSVILLTTLLVTLFLHIEARRYRFYEVWSARVRLMETDFFAAMLVPPFQPTADWAETLADNLLHPHFTISSWEALGRRYRRNYMWIYLALALAWVANVALHPMTVTSWSDFVNRAVLGAVPGWAVLAAGIVFNVVLMALGVLTVGLQQASGEVLPRFGTVSVPIRTGEGAPPAREEGGGWRAWFRPSQRRQQLLAFIITDHAQVVGERIISDMKRGATSLFGTGMFTGQMHSVLLCALTVTEVGRLRSLVSEVDPKAFVIVSPATEVLGPGFMPLRAEAES